MKPIDIFLRIVFISLLGLLLHNKGNVLFDRLAQHFAHIINFGEFYPLGGVDFGSVERGFDLDVVLRKAYHPTRFGLTLPEYFCLCAHIFVVEIAVQPLA